MIFKSHHPKYIVLNKIKKSKVLFLIFCTEYVVNIIDCQRAVGSIDGL